MILINFSHPITEAQHAQLSEMLAHPVSLTIDIRSQIDMAQPIAPQVRAMVDSAALTPERWQSEQIVVNLPALNHSAGLVVAEPPDQFERNMLGWLLALVVISDEHSKN